MPRAPSPDPIALADQLRPTAGSSDIATGARLLRLSDETDQFYKTYPPLQRLIAELDEQSQSPEDVLAAVRRHLDGKSVLPLIRRELETYRQEDWYASPALPLGSGAMSGWALLSHEKALVTITVIDAAQWQAAGASTRTSTISFPAGDISITLLAGRELAFTRWSAPVITDDRPVSSDQSCKNEGSIRLAQGQSLVCRGGVETVEFSDIPETAVILQAYSRLRRSSVSVDYDRETRLVARLTAADQRINRLQIVMTIARQFHRRDAIPALCALTRHRDHYVRWQAARELTVLDPDGAFAVLSDLKANDPNPRLRENAAKTLSYLADRGYRAA